MLLFWRTLFFYNIHNINRRIQFGSLQFNKTMPKPGFYAVRKGRIPGVYTTWAECEMQTKGYPHAAFKKFPDRISAEHFVSEWSHETDSVNPNPENALLTEKNHNQYAHILTNNNENVKLFNFALSNPPTNKSFDSNKTGNLCDKLNASSMTFPKLSYDKRNKDVFYAVHKGRKPGVYRTWTECQEQIRGVKCVSYRKFDNEQDALNYVQTGGINKATKRELDDIIICNQVKKIKTEDKAAYILRNPDESVTVFTDGASSKNGKKQAAAGIGVYWGPNHPLNVSKRLSGRQTNNRAEIHAAIYAIRQAKQICAKKVNLYTDSQFLIHAITDWMKKWKKNGWKLVNGQSVVNKDDFLELEAVSEGLDIEWKYVKAHANIQGNEEADRLAVAGSKLVLQPENCSEFAWSSLVLPEKEKKVFYAVHKGEIPGIYYTWTDCERQVKNFNNPSFRKFQTEAEADYFVKTGKMCQNPRIPPAEIDGFVPVYTDGACCNNGKDGCSAGIGIFWQPGHHFNTSLRLPGRQTNNRAEIFAAVYALKQAKIMGITKLRIYTDSKFVINGITDWILKWKENNWKSANGKPVINKEDFIALEKACKDVLVDWCHVKGHSNIPGNVEADKLAVEGCNKPLSDTVLWD